MIKALLVCDDLPSTHYGTGQRLLSLQRALASLGECRILHLTNEPASSSQAYQARLPFDFRASRLAWAKRLLTFAEARRDNSYRCVFENIRKEYPFDLVLCSFFRNASVVPTDMVDCILDFDAIPERRGFLTRALWPLTLRAMRRRAKDFRALYAIRRSDAELFNDCGPVVRVLPGISASAPPDPLPHNPQARRILFVAPTSWPPNRSAIDWLLGEGLPGALSSRGFELRVIGVGTDQYPPQPGLSCGGFVDDLIPEYAAARLVLCPIRSGGGANIKLAEAIQFGRPVLASRHSAAGFEGFLRAGQDLIVFDEDDCVVDILLASLENPDRLAALEQKAARAAKRFLNQSYMNRIVGTDVANIFQKKTI